MPPILGVSMDTHGLHEVYDVINLIVSTLAFVWVAGVIAVYTLFIDPPNLLVRVGRSGKGELSGAGWGIIFWCLWWGSLAVTYALLSGYSGTNLSVLLWPSDLGNLAALAGAIAYSRGDAFRTRDLLAFGILAIVLPIVAGSVAWLIPGPTGRMLAIAPSAVVSTVAMISMGWSILVRCGWRTSPFLLVVCIYACLQVPAYIDAMVLRAAGLEGNFSKVTSIFFVLAFFKIIVGLAFLGYFFSSDHKEESLRQEKAWPSGTDRIRMQEQYASVLKWGAGVLGAFIVGQISTPKITETLVNLLRRLFNSA